MKVVSEESAIPVSLILTKTRKREIVELRQKAMSLSKIFTGASLATIGQEIGDKDHATVLHACKTVNDLIDTDKSYKGSYTNLYIKIGKIIETMPGKTLVCSKCGSSNVQIRAWIGANTRMPAEEFDSNDMFNNWCPECNTYVDIIPKSEYFTESL